MESIFVSITCELCCCSNEILQNDSGTSNGLENVSSSANSMIISYKTLVINYVYLQIVKCAHEQHTHALIPAPTSSCGVFRFATAPP